MRKDSISTKGGNMNISKIIFAASLVLGSSAFATQSVELLPSVGHENKSLLDAKVVQQVAQHFNLADFREVRAQIINNDYVLVYLHSNTAHRVDFAKAKLVNGQITEVTSNYQLTAQDHAAQGELAEPKCPDESIEFLSMCPNNDSFELNITKDVAAAAVAKGLKTKTLLIKEMSRAAMLNYMSCPNLKGTFYDGDANTSVVVTGDGEVTSAQLKSGLKSKLRYKVVNIWLACEAFNNPLHDVMLNDVQSQKYAAGINDLLVGPSDNAAACTMKAAFEGTSISAAFKDCYDKFDDKRDQWGFDGKGSDIFGQ
jgi:hypothetical protein